MRRKVAQGSLSSCSRAPGSGSKTGWCSQRSSLATGCLTRDAVLAAVALVAFCALSSFAYVLNDISDREADRLNPEKRDRPLARGDLTIAQAACFAIALGAIKTLLSIALGRYFLGIAAFYVALQVGYSLWAKHYKVLDVVAVAIGFVLRAFGGGVAIGAVVGRRGSSSSPLCWRCCWYSAGANTNW
jgi:decaprenyl-phosphate phosphoribosyltransferase